MKHPTSQQTLQKCGAWSLYGQWLLESSVRKPHFYNQSTLSAGAKPPRIRLLPLFLLYTRLFQQNSLDRLVFAAFNKHASSPLPLLVQKVLRHATTCSHPDTHTLHVETDRTIANSCSRDLWTQSHTYTFTHQHRYTHTQI